MYRLFSRPLTSFEKLFALNEADSQLVDKQLHYLVCTRHENVEQKDEMINFFRLALFKEAGKVQNELKQQKQEYLP